MHSPLIRPAIVLLCMMAGFCICLDARAAITVDDSLRLQADSLTDTALALYGQARYGEALLLLEDCDSTELRIDSVSYERAHVLQWLCLCYYHQSRYPEAITAAETARDIIAATRGEDSSEYATLLHHLSIFHSCLGNYPQAIALSEQVLSLRSGEEGVDYADALDNTARLYSLMGNYQKAIELCQQAIDIYDEYVGQEYAGYSTTLGNLALYQSYMGNYTEALTLCEEALELCRQQDMPDEEEQATLLGNLAYLRGQVAHFDEAIELCYQAMETQMQQGADAAEITNSLNNLAYLYAAKGNYPQAIAIAEQALHVCDSLIGNNVDIYATTLDNLANYHAKMGNYEQAWELATQAQALRILIFGTLHADYAASLSTIALCLSYMGQSNEALQFAQQATDIYAATVGTDHHQYAASLCNLATYLAAVSGDYQQAITLCEQAKQILANKLGEKHPTYATALDNLAHYYALVGSYDEAMELCQQAEDIRQQTLGERHPDYATSLSNHAYYYSCIGNYDAAVELCSQAIDIRSALSTNNLEYATLLDNMARYLYFVNDYEEAIDLCRQSIAIREEVSGNGHPDYVNALNNLGIYLSAIEEYEEAITVGEQALYLRELISGTEHPDYATALDNLAAYHAGLEDYYTADTLATQALDIREHTLGTEHSDYLLSLGKLATYQYFLADTLLLDYYTSRMTTSTTQLVRSTFATLTAYERTLFWQMYSDWFGSFIHFFAYGMPTDTLASTGYNSVLLSKGLLLNSEIEFSRFIQESGDSATTALYQEMCDLRAQANWHSERFSSTTNVDSLRSIVRALTTMAQERENQLLRNSKTYGDYTRELVVTWQDVQAQLGPDDAAIEFVRFPWQRDSVLYVAYVLRSDSLPPRMIPLFEQKDLKAINMADYYKTSALAQLVWQPLQAALEGVKRVFFSPDGMLYNIAIEAVPACAGSKQWVDEERDYFRLSSTRELAIARDTCLWQQAAVYGGLDYRLNMSDMVAIDTRYQAEARTKRGETYVDIYDVEGDSLSDERLLRGWTLDSLPGTRYEAIAIKEQLDALGIATTLYTDSLGTEGSVKALSGTGLDVLHIGTHGFFHEDTQQTNSQLLTLNSQLLTSKVVGDEALSRSGLYFAGAVDARKHRDKLPDGMDDGKLTALEIAFLDLRGLDLTVLSACQTALGEISGEGVFGLQRGFKKAGAQAIVMSLWNVDDEVTGQFMTLFFSHLSRLGSANKHAAFVAAQQELRRNIAGQRDIADEWAAFVLLDGM